MILNAQWVTGGRDRELCPTHHDRAILSGTEIEIVTATASENETGIQVQITGQVDGVMATDPLHQSQQEHLMEEETHLEEIEDLVARVESVDLVVIQNAVVTADVMDSELLSVTVVEDLGEEKKIEVSVEEDLVTEIVTHHLEKMDGLESAPN